MAVKQLRRKRRYIPTGNPRGRPRKVVPITPPAEPAAMPLASPGPQPLAYRIPAAARAVGVSASKMKRMVGKGEIRSVVRGRMRLIPADALRQYAGIEERGA
jgi:excisionase family DNA binding protein